MSISTVASKSRRRLLIEISLLILFGAVALVLWVLRGQSTHLLQTAGIEKLQEIINREPTNFMANYQLGKRFEDKGDLAQAKAAYKKAAELDGDSEDAWLAWARVTEIQGEIQEAFSILSVFTKTHKNSTNGYLALATFYHNQDALRRAYDTAQEAARIDPKNVRAWRRVATEAFDLQLFAQAEAAIRKGIELTPQDWRSYNLLGLSLYQQHKAQEALSSFQKAIELEPKESDPVREQGKIQLETSKDANDLKKAETTLLKAKELAPQDGETQLLLGKLYVRQGRWEEARKQLEAATASTPNEPDAYFELKKVYAHSGNKTLEKQAQTSHDELQAYHDKRYNLQSLIYEDKDDIEKSNGLRLQLARLFVQHRDYALAVREYKHLQVRLPNDPLVRKELTDAEQLASANAAPVSAETVPINAANASLNDLLRQGDNLMDKQQYEAAKHLYVQILVKNPKLAVGYFGLGQALMGERDDANAYRAFQKALSLDPNLEAAQYPLAQIYLHLGFGDETVRRMETLVKKHPDNAGYHNLLGLGYQQVEVYGPAEQQFEQAVSLDASDLDYLVNLAYVEAKNGHSQQAEQHYRDAVKRDPQNGPLLAFFGSFLNDQATSKHDTALSQEAEEVLKRSLTLAPKNFTATLALGNLYLARNDARQAIPFLKLANESKPEAISPWYRLSVAYERLGDRVQSEYYQKEFRRRQEYFDRRSSTEMLARERIKDPALRLKLARIYAEGGDYSRAINQYQMCLSLDSKNVTAKKELETLMRDLKSKGKMPAMDMFNGLVSASSNK